MGPTEIASRVSDMGRHSWLRGSLSRVQLGAKHWPTSALSEIDFSRLRALVSQVGVEQRETVVDLADQWVAHRASFLGLQAVSLGTCINWHRDYGSGVVAPQRYSESINYRDAAVAGDVKNIWELNRHHQLVLLALAQVWSGNVRYEQELLAQLTSWREQNPFMYGLNWKSPLESAMRLIAWAQVVGLLTEQERVQRFFRQDMRTTLYEHQYVLRTFFSKHSSANNHLIGEMAGLYVGSVVWPWYRESGAWRAFARQSLIDEMERQVEEDGAGRERATEYQLFILEFFLLAGTLGQAIGEPFPPHYWERLRRMLTLLAVMGDRAGHLPVFGDGDGGQVVWLPETLGARAESRIRLARDSVGAVADDTVVPDLRAVLSLWGQSPADIPLAPVKVPLRRLQSFPQGGYYVLSSHRGAEHECLVVVDAGPHGLGPLYAHGHADALSFWLSYGGYEFVVDPGTFCYFGNEDWRSYFRSTAAHNTVRVDGVDQSVAQGRFLWGPVARCQVERTDETETSIDFEASHDGYHRLSDPVTHRRQLSLSKTSAALAITDQLDCRHAHQVELFFHFSETCEVTALGSGHFALVNGDRQLCLEVDSQLIPELYRGSEQPIAGWVSPHFGVKSPSFTLVARGEITDSTQFCSRIFAP